MKEFYSKNWNEFDWEMELKKEDVRTNLYINDVNYFIDIPGEEKILLKRLQDNPKLTTHKVSWRDKYFSNITDSTEDEFFVYDDWKNRQGANIYMAVEKSASLWCIIFSSFDNIKLNKLGIEIICDYGKTLGGIADLIELSEEDVPTLKIALCKRIHTEINVLIGKLYEVSELMSNSTKINELILNLQIVRERILDLLKIFRNI